MILETLSLLAEINGSITLGLAGLGAGIGIGLVGLGASQATGRNLVLLVRFLQFPLLLWPWLRRLRFMD